MEKDIILIDDSTILYDGEILESKIQTVSQIWITGPTLLLWHSYQFYCIANWRANRL